MLFWVFSIAIFSLMMLSISVGVLKGGKYVWIYSAVRVGNIVVSAVLSVIICLIVGRFAGNLISDFALSILPNSLAETLRDLPSASGAIGAFVVMLLSPLVFYLLFTLIRGIIALFAPTISCAIVKASKKEDTTESLPYAEDISKKKRLRAETSDHIGMILGGICGLLMFIVLASPLTAYVTVANGAMMIVGSGEENVIAPVVSVTQAAADNVGTKTVRLLGGDLLVSGMTSYKLDGRTSNLIREGGVIAELGEAVYSVRDPSCDRVEAAIEVREVGDAIEKARFIPAVCAEVLDSASTDWTNGEAYAGINAPATNGSFGKFTKTVYKSFEGSTCDTFKKDAHTLANIVACLVEFDVIDSLKFEPLSILKNESVTQNVIFEFLDNERMDDTVNGLIDFGMSAMCEKLGVRDDMSGVYEQFLTDLGAISAESAIDEDSLASVEQEYSDLFDKYALRVEEGFAKKAALADAEGNDMAWWLASEGVISSQSDIEAKSELVTMKDIEIRSGEIADKAAEAAKLARALCEVSVLVGDIGEGGDITSVVTGIGPLLDVFAKTETVGAECTANMLIAMLQSNKITKDIGYGVLEATELAKTINEGAGAEGGYTVQMKAIARMVDVIKKSSGNEDMKSSLKEMLKDLTPESAKTMRAAATPSVMKQNGVPDRSAVPASNMVSDMFGNLSDAQTSGMSDEQLDRETAAVNNVMNIAMSVDGSKSSTFGEGSATGMSAAEYVDDIMNSEVVSKTVVDQVYGEGQQPKTDPLNSERNVSEQDEAELVSALDAKWQNASAEEKADGEFAKRIIATASLLNVSVSVTDTGVVKA